MPRSAKGRIRILIIGAGKAGELVGRSIAVAKETSFYVVGYVDDDPVKFDKIVAGRKAILLS